ncbi:MAG: helix-turn-helix domain-containing protein [Acidobacteriota bacterium]
MHSLLSLSIPPLRERKEDILPLTEFFLQEEKDEKKRDYFLTKEAKTILQNHPFPGNVRELKNIIKRAVFLTEKEKIDEEIIKKSISEPQITKKRAKISIGEIKNALKRFNGNKTKAAGELGISRRYLYKILEKM